MRAAVLTPAHADPACLDFPEPEPFPDRPILTLAAAGVHPVVRAMAAGRHYGSTSTYPLVPGVDAVASAPDGSLVYTGFTRAPWGTMAEHLATPFDLPLPPGADPLRIAAGMNPAMSGFIPLATHLEQQGTLGTVLILGATGIAGRAAVQAAAALGAERVIAAGRNEQALDEIAAFGAEPVSIAGSLGSLQNAVARQAPALVLDYLWGQAAEATFAALARQGMTEDRQQITYVELGSAAGPAASLPASLLRSRRITISGSGAGSMSTEQITTLLPRLMGYLADGTITVSYTAYPLERIADAWMHQARTRAVVTP